MIHEKNKYILCAPNAILSKIIEYHENPWPSRNGRITLGCILTAQIELSWVWAGVGLRLTNNTCLAFSKFLLSGETIKTFTRITDTILNTFLMDWTSQLELSLAKFDITVWMSVGRFSQTPCTHITTLCRSRKPCNCHYETNALYLEAGTVLSL